jgi:hypothetical protein
VIRNVRIYRLVNAARTSAYRGLVCDRDLVPKEAWARLVEINKVEVDSRIFWSLSEEIGEYDVESNTALEVCKSDLSQEETHNIRLTETLRNVTMEAVLSLLDCWGIHSTVEFPGYLNVEFKEKNMYWAVGPIQDGDPDPTDYVWTGELHTVEGHMINSLKIQAATLRELTEKLYYEMKMKVEQG